MVNEAFLTQFEKRFGPHHSSFDHHDCHYILLNSQLFNSGLKEEETQRRWLEKDLQANRCKRIFMFTHYPPFITDPDEEEHYDNLSEPARSWLSEALKRHHNLLESVEIIIPWRKAPQYINQLIQLRKQSNLPIYLSKLRSSADAKKVGSRFKHFIKHVFLARILIIN